MICSCGQSAVGPSGETSGFKDVSCLFWNVWGEGISTPGLTLCLVMGLGRTQGGALYPIYLCPGEGVSGLWEGYLGSLVGSHSLLDYRLACE